MIKLNLEKIAILKDKNQDKNELSKPFKPSDEPLTPPADEPDAPDEPAPNDPDAPEELDDPEIDDEHPLPQMERTATEERPEDRKLAGYAALREEDREEDTLRQKMAHFALKPTPRQRCGYTAWKPAHYGRNEDWTTVLKEMRYGKTLPEEW